MTREEELKELEYREQRKVLVVVDGEETNTWLLCECPACTEELNEHERFKYCPYCGQKLDWNVLDI